MQTDAAATEVKKEPKTAGSVQELHGVDLTKIPPAKEPISEAEAIRRLTPQKQRAV